MDQWLARQSAGQQPAATAPSGRQPAAGIWLAAAPRRHRPRRSGFRECRGAPAKAAARDSLRQRQQPGGERPDPGRRRGQFIRQRRPCRRCKSAACAMCGSPPAGGCSCCRCCCWQWSGCNARPAGTRCTAAAAAGGGSRCGCRSCSGPDHAATAAAASVCQAALANLRGGAGGGSSSGPAEPQARPGRGPQPWRRQRDRRQQQRRGWQQRRCGRQRGARQWRRRRCVRQQPAA